jgi:predicted HTH transcriptional regulator
MESLPTRIITLLKANNKLTQPEIAKISAATLYKTKGAMNDPVEQNIIERVGSRHHGYWHVRAWNAFAQTGSNL